MEEGDKCLAEMLAELIIEEPLERHDLAVKWTNDGDLLFSMQGPETGYFFRDFSVLIFNGKQIEVVSQDNVALMVMMSYPFDGFNVSRVKSKARRLELN